MGVINPFTFGRVVRGKYFCNRRREMKKVNEAAKSKGNLIIVSPRRFGKTSLVINALEKYSIPFLFIDCFDVEEEKSLLEKVTAAYFEALKKGDLVDKLKALSKSVNLEYSFSAKGVTVKINKYHDQALREVLQEAAQHHVLVFDEFQELFAVNPQLVKKLRGILQLLHQGFIFLGSRKHLLFYLFSDQRSPFYNFGSIMYLDKIPEEEWSTFIQAKFTATGVMIKESEIAQLLTSSELIPFYVQYLCYYYWQRKREGHAEPVPIFVENLIQANSYVYEELYLKLPASQKQALRVLLQKDDKVFSQETLQEFRIASAQMLNKAIGALVDKGFLEKNGTYQFNDPLFKKYLRMKEGGK